MALNSVEQTFAQISRAREQLAAQGIGNQELDEMIRQEGAEKLLNSPAVAQYFRQMASALLWLVQQYDFDNPTSAQAAQVPGPADYQEFFSGVFDTSGTVPFEGHLPRELIHQPELLAKEAGLSPEQVAVLKVVFERGLGPLNQPQEAPPPAGASASPIYKNMSGPGGGALPSTPPPGFPMPTGPNTAGLPTAQARTQLEQAFGPDHHFYGMFQDLFNNSDQTKAAMASLVAQLQGHSARKQEIQALMAGLDATNPEDMGKLQALSAELESFQTDEQLLMQQLSSLQQKDNQIKELVKGIMSIANSMFEAIIRNMRN